MPCLCTQTKPDDLILLLRVEVVEKDVAFLTLFTPITDNYTRAVDDFAWVTFAIDLAYRLNRLASCHNGRYQNHVQSPAHSPSCFPSGTLIKGMLCSEHSATTNFLYASSSHASLRTHI